MLNLVLQIVEFLFGFVKLFLDPFELTVCLGELDRGQFGLGLGELGPEPLLSSWVVSTEYSIELYSRLSRLT